MRHSDRLAAKRQAFELAFEGRWTRAEIASRCGVAARTLDYWLAAPEFRAQLDEARTHLAASLRDVAYANKRDRIVGLSQMAEHARREYEARPLLVERRPVGRDPDTGETLMLEQESFNRDAHEAFRKSLDDIARELGERSSNVNVTAQVATLGISVVLESMRHDDRIADAAAEFVGLLDTARETEG